MSGPASTTAARAAGRPAVARAVLALGVLMMAACFGLAAAYTYDVVAQLWIGVSAFVVFVPTVLALRRLELTGALRRSGALLFGVAVLFDVLAVTGPPGTSDDDWRYLWDGRVQVHGVDPYRYVARAPELTPLRTAAIFPPARPCHYHTFAEPGEPEDNGDLQSGCTRMNRPTVNTVYPPVAEAFYALVYVVSFGGHGNEFSMQVAAGLGVLVIGWLLWRRLKTRGDPVWWAALWLWCPTVVIEAVQNAHIDWLGVLFVAIAIAAVPARLVVLRGLLLGAAIGVKLYPAVVGASLVKRRPVRLIAAALGLFAVGYVPHVLAVGTGVIGFLPTYLVQEDYGSGSRFLLVSLIAPGSAATVVAVVIVLAATGWAVWRGDPDRPEATAVVLFGVVLLVATPNQAWYSLLLVMLATLARRPEWLLIGAITPVYYLCQGHVPDPQVVGRWLFVGTFVIVVATGVWRQRRVSGRPRATPPDPAVASAG